MQFIFICHNDTIAEYGNGFSTSMGTSECEWKWRDKILNRQQARPRPAAEDVKAFRTNPQWVSALQFTFLLFFNWLVFPAAAKTSGMEGRRANEDPAIFETKTTGAGSSSSRRYSDRGASTAPCWERAHESEQSLRRSASWFSMAVLTMTTGPAHNLSGTSRPAKNTTTCLLCT